MAFKYTVVTDTMPWIGYNVLEQPQEVLSAVKEAGYDGIDLPGDVSNVDQLVKLEVRRFELIFLAGRKETVLGVVVFFRGKFKQRVRRNMVIGHHQSAAGNK